MIGRSAGSRRSRTRSRPIAAARHCAHARTNSLRCVPVDRDDRVPGIVARPKLRRLASIQPREAGRHDLAVRRSIHVADRVEHDRAAQRVAILQPRDQRLRPDQAEFLEVGCRQHNTAMEPPASEEARQFQERRDGRAVVVGSGRATHGVMVGDDDDRLLDRARQHAHEVRTIQTRVNVGRFARTARAVAERVVELALDVLQVELLAIDRPAGGAPAVQDVRIGRRHRVGSVDAAARARQRADELPEVVDLDRGSPATGCGAQLRTWIRVCRFARPRHRWTLRAADGFGSESTRSAVPFGSCASPRTLCGRTPPRRWSAVTQARCPATAARGSRGSGLRRWSSRPLHLLRPGASCGSAQPRHQSPSEDGDDRTARYPGASGTSPASPERP